MFQNFRERSRAEQLLIVTIGFVFLFCLLTLNIPAISGDEAVYTFILEEGKRLLSGGGASLNPLIGYTGPLDFWAMGSVYGILVSPNLLSPQPWMVRIIPFSIFWIGAFVLFREVRILRGNERPDRQTFPLWFLLLAASCPMVLIWSHVGFPHPLLLGLFAYFLAESFRIARTGEVRWIRLALLAGFSTEAHTTAFLGHLIVFLPVITLLGKAARRNPGKAALAVTIYLALAFPVLKNFPPPASAHGEQARSLGDELIAFFSIMAGHQPFRFLLHVEPVPRIAVLGFLIFLLTVFFRYVTGLFREARSFARPSYLWIWRRVFLAHLLGTFFLLVMSYRGRSLTFIGHERYFLPLVPGWTLFWADALWKFLPKRRGWICSAVIAYFFLQFSIPILKYSAEQDPSMLAARWLEKECPRERCVASTLDFWSYWPLRYYLRGSFGKVDLNLQTPTWKPIEEFPRKGRELGGCWLAGTEEDFARIRSRIPGRKRAELFIPLQDAASGGYACFAGIEALYWP